MYDDAGVSVETPIPLFPTIPAANTPVSQPSAPTWVERAPHKRLMLFAGRSNPALGERIAEHLGVELGHTELKTFTNGEVYVRYEESIRGAGDRGHAVVPVLAAGQEERSARADQRQAGR